jgi:hypothetical protein
MKVSLNSLVPKSSLSHQINVLVQSASQSINANNEMNDTRRLNLPVVECDFSQKLNKI